MKAIAALLFFACGHPGEPTASPAASAPVTAAATATTNATATATVTASASVTATATATATVTAPPMARCALGQLNVPCVFQRDGECFTRRANCTALPCTESAPERVDCSVLASARPPSACDIVAKCHGVSDEGCEVTDGACNPMRTCIRASCASSILTAKSCAQLSSLASSCIK